MCKCACKSDDARQCFLLRHPECLRNSDDTDGMYDQSIDEECECGCHEMTEQEYWDSLDEYTD